MEVAADNLGLQGKSDDDQPDHQDAKSWHYIVQLSYAQLEAFDRVQRQQLTRMEFILQYPASESGLKPRKTKESGRRIAFR